MQITRLLILAALAALFTPAVPAQGVTSYFPHMAEGTMGSQAFGTEFNINNFHVAPATVTLSFFDDNGAPWAVDLFSADRGDAAGPAKSSTIFTLQPNETVHLVTKATAPLKVGWAVLASTLPVLASASFQEFRMDTGQMLWVAGVLPAQAAVTSVFNANVSKCDLNLGNPAVDIGFAIANPNASAANVTVVLRASTGGAPVSTKTIAVPPGGHMSQFLSGLFNDVNWGNSFHGVVQFASDAKVAAVALKSTTTGGNTVYSSLPVVPSYELFKFIRTVQVTPDTNFKIGGFVRVGYVPATDNLAVTFGTRLTQPIGGCTDSAHAYKEYTLDMQATGRSGVLNCETGDLGGMLTDNVFYDASMHRQGDSIGWRLVKYDAVTWAKLADIFFPLDTPREGDGDMMVAFVNGRLDVSSGFTTYGGPPPPEQGAATHHEFFSPDLNFLEKKILSDTPHICGSSLICVDGIYYFITATAYTGDVIVMKYDKNWQYLGAKELRKQAHWSEGVAFDGQRFYIAYLDTSQRTDPGFFPYYPNVHLAAFDRDWNLVDDVAVTNFAASDSIMTGRPWVILHGNKLYVSYDVAPNDPITHQDDLTKIEAFVSVYELAR